MKKIDTKLGISLVVIAMLIFLITPMGQAAADSAAKLVDAQIVNTPDNPVPVATQGATQVQGSVTVSNTTSEPVPVSNQGTTDVAGTVTVGNEPTVKLSDSGNTVKLAGPLQVVNADNKRPVTISLQADFPSVAYQDNAGVSYTVPQGKTLYIDYISVYNPKGRLAIWSGVFKTTQSKLEAKIPFDDMVPPSAYNDRSWGTNREFKAVVEGGDTFTFTATRFSDQWSYTGDKLVVSVTGNLIDAPQQ